MKTLCHCCGQTLNVSNGSSWVQIVKKGRPSAKAKECAHQATCQATVHSPDTYSEKLVNVKHLACSDRSRELSGDKELIAAPGCTEQDRSDNKSTDCVESFRQLWIVTS